MPSTLALIVALTLTAFQALAFSSVRVQVLDRGQADGIVIRTPNSQWVVIDAGTNGQQADYMAEMGIETVALAVISHRHFDHHGGMDDHGDQLDADVLEGSPPASSSMSQESFR